MKMMTKAAFDRLNIKTQEHVESFIRLIYSRWEGRIIFHTMKGKVVKREEIPE